MSSPNRTQASVADFRFRVGGFETDELRVTAFEGAEGISELFEFRIRLCSENHSIDSESMLGLASVLEIDGEHGTRFVHGIIKRFGQTGHGSKLAHYEAQLVPPHWLLTKRIQSRVFNQKRCPHMDAIGIVSKVFTDAGLLAENLKVVTSRTYEPREFTAQYRESDWDFVSRLLEEEGIYYFFDHTADGCKLVLMDSMGLHQPYVESGFEVPFRDANGMVEESEFVFQARLANEVQIGAVSLDDFNFRQPATELRRVASSARFSALELADFPGHYQDDGRGRRLVETRLEEMQCEKLTVALEATVREFRPGYRFALIEHSDARFNSDYLIASLAHRATQPQSAEEEAGGDEGLRYGVDIRAIPADVQFRPPRCTPRPTVLGSQTAIVVGPPSEEIHTDAYGRVEVRFHWDQEATYDVGASCWIRVSQGLAGGNYGMMFLPRVGQEVIVDFLEGDPDRPIVTGRVYNNDHMPPYTLPDAKSISTIRTCTTPGAKGGNEVRFDDAKGDEQLLLFAQKDLHFRARSGRLESTLGNRHATVIGDHYESVQKNKHSNVKLDRLEMIGGNKELTVLGDIRESCGGSRVSDFMGDMKVNADGVVRLEASSIVLACNGNFLKIDQSGITLVGGMVKINSGGSSGPVFEFPELKELTEPSPAATTQFGHNTRYSATPDALAALDPSDPPSGNGQTESETDLAWIEIEQIDEAGRPCVGQRYEIKLPDGRIRHGALNEHGLAHESVPQNGVCQISFPDLDAAAWERIG